MSGYSFASAQLSAGGYPLGLQRDDLNTLEPIVLPPIDRQSAVAEADRREAVGFPYTFGKMRQQHLELNDFQQTTLPDDSRISRIKVQSVGALGISIYFSEFRLKPGVEVFAYSPDGRQVKGAFTARNNKAAGKFAIGHIHGEAVVLEVYEPADVVGQSQMTVSRFGHAFRGRQFRRPMSRRTDFGGSDTCEVNVNCSEGDDYREIQRSVVHYTIPSLFFEGACTGAMVGNTQQDSTPYFLTAEHCGLDQSPFGSGGFVDNNALAQWVFYFNYEAPDCQNPASDFGLDAESITGAVHVANSDDGGGDSGSDMALLELTLVPPPNYDPFYAGWDTRDQPSLRGVGIHHPAGDIKKISTYTQALKSTGWNGSFLGSHWEVRWSSTDNGWGVTEGGSSGSPIFDEFGLIRGTLTGGGSFCDAQTQSDSYGKFSYHWISNGSSANRRLKPWLDPLDSNPTTLLGYDPYDSTTTSRPQTALAAFDLAPNPADQQLRLVLDQQPESGIVAIYTTTGQLVQQNAVTSIQTILDVSELPTGVYMVQVAVDGQQQTQKVVIRH